jgi:hypothetical protein
MAALTALEAGTSAGLPAAARLRAAYLATPPASRLAALGLAISATVHLALALAPPHGARSLPSCLPLTQLLCWRSPGGRQPCRSQAGAPSGRRSWAQG